MRFDAILNLRAKHRVTVLPGTGTYDPDEAEAAV
jgi:hypothetical protein